jgi:site-specific DNA recombinase
MRLSANGVGGMKKAIIYIRVSSSDQVKTSHDAEGYSIPAQREACLRKAESIGAEVVAQFSEPGESARTADRPKLQEMLKYLTEHNDIDYVIVHKLDRLARNTFDDVTINFAIQKAGASLVSVMENFDASPSGYLMHSIMAGIAEFYSRNLSTEVVKGMTQKAKTGGTLHKAPLGYLNTIEMVNGHEVRSVSVDLERAPMILFAFETYATGNISIVELADVLTEKGFRMRIGNGSAGGRIYPGILNKLLKNPYYCGQIVHRGVMYKGRHKALITRELFDKVQMILKARLQGEKQRIHLHYLKGTVYCGLCQSRLFIVCPKGTYYFSCLQHRHGCAMPYINAERIEMAIENYYSNVKISKEDANAVREEVQRLLSSRRETAQADLARQEAATRQLTLQRNKLMQAYYADAMPLDLFASEQERINKEASRIESKLATSRQEYSDIEETLNLSLELLKSCKEFYSKAPKSLRRQMNQALFEKILITPEGTVSEAISAQPFSDLLKLKNEMVNKVVKTKNKAGSLVSHAQAIFMAADSEDYFLVAGAGFEPATFGL